MSQYKYWSDGRWTLLKRCSLLYGSIKEENLSYPLEPAKKFFFGWLEQNWGNGYLCGKCLCQQPTTNTLFRFAERNEKKFVDVVKKEAQSIGKIKVEFAISMNFGENVGKEWKCRVNTRSSLLQRRTPTRLASHFQYVYHNNVFPYNNNNNNNNNN